jgi:LysR family transcriptional regulator, glycine cleavage system transcriptional activator
MVDRRFPSLSSIRAFEAAARLGSFAKAARELGTSSASVSYHVRQLEAQIGLPLFRRHDNTVELTESGSLIAQETVNAFAALRATFARAIDAHQGRLSLTTLPTLATSWLTPRLGRFRAKHPDIQIDLDVSTVAHDLAASPFDAAVRNGHGRWPGLRTTLLFPAIFMPLCTPALKHEATRLTDPEGLRNIPLLGRPDWWALWYRALGFSNGPPPERFGTSLPTEHLDAAAALAGQGITIGSPILFRSKIEAGRLIPAHDLVAADGRSFWFTYPVAQHCSRKINIFREWLCEEAMLERAASAEFIRRAITIDSGRD